MNERDLEFAVEGHLIRRLPKTSKVPKAFFENAYSNLKKRLDGSYSVAFSVRGLGGWEPTNFTCTVNGKSLEFKKFTDNLSALDNKQGLYMFINAHEKKVGYHTYICILNGNTLGQTRTTYEAQLIKDLCAQRNNHYTGKY